jgi:hypothetical protein
MFHNYLLFEYDISQAERICDIFVADDKKFYFSEKEKKRLQQFQN